MIHRMPLQRADRDRCRLTSIEHTGLLAQDFGRAGARAGAAEAVGRQDGARRAVEIVGADLMDETRSEEHTSELQSLMRISYAVFCLKNKTKEPTQQQQRV